MLVEVPEQVVDDSAVTVFTAGAAVTVVEAVPDPEHPLPSV